MPASPDGRCVSHERWSLLDVAQPSEYYHEKIVKGLITPTDEYLSDAEQEAVINGRYRGDGRHLDAHISADPMMLTLPDPLKKGAARATQED